MSTDTSTQATPDDPSRWMRQHAPLTDEGMQAAADHADLSAFDPLYEVRVLETGEVMVLPKEDRTKRERGEHKRISEEFRMIKRPLLMNAFERRHDGDSPFNLIMVSSSVQSEGKTFVSLNLAASMTLELDCWVLLIDGDVAKPGLSRRLGLGDAPGLIEHLDEGTDLAVDSTHGYSQAVGSACRAAAPPVYGAAGEPEHAPPAP
jgi:Mrp family chromosome partitioning ATPase